MSVALIPVPVHRHTLFVAHAADAMVPLRPISDALGLNWPGQQQKLRAHPSFAPCVSMIHTHDASGRRQEMLCMPAWTLPGWLLTIHPNKVSPRVRETLVGFQQHASRLLYEAWWAARHGLPAPGGRPAGDLLERVEGPPPLRDHPAVAQAIALVQEAGRDIAEAFRTSRAKQKEARRIAARAGLSARELKILVERERWLAQRPSAQSPLLDA
ncbi:MAG: phage antirepressor N-terminal domain-containing protein [Acetobacteraceae bacterium]|nr:phage antirepressor N-terminal domain-containing protein [Acetobacteraceae bacterium]